MFRSEKSLFGSVSVEMRVPHEEMRVGLVVCVHLPLEDQLRDGGRVKGLAGRGVLGPLSGGVAVVMNRR